jgi:vanillate/3-O-methylgallate O-demethylase
VTTGQADTSLQDLVDRVPDLVDYFYNDTLAPHYRARTGLTAAYIPPAFTNWRDEQRSWRETAVLFDQSHHMPELWLRGPDALAVLTHVGIGTFSNFTTDRAKHFIACTPRGHVVGDCIAYNLGDDGYELVSGMAVLNWVHYHAETGGYDVSVERDDPTPYNPKGKRIKYRFQLDGPNANAILGDVVDGGAPEIPFFRTARVKIAGCEVLALRHSMAGHHGAELSGPYEDMDVVRDAIVEAGKPHGILQSGTQAYFSTVFESGWIAYPLPGIYTGDELRGFREWLPGDGWEANAQLGGSFYSSSIEDYYNTPWELGYGHILKFDHDFIGREALESMSDGPHRRKVTLVWNDEDVLRLYASQFGAGPRYKSVEFPTSYYGWPQCDEVRDLDGSLVGLAAHSGYSGNEGVALSLGVVDEGHAEPGTELVLVWGEPGGGSRKPHVEKHEQAEVRVTVAPAPIAAAAREMKSATAR